MPESFDGVVDKTLLDTLTCAEERWVTIGRYLREVCEWCEILFLGSANPPQTNESNFHAPNAFTTSKRPRICIPHMNLQHAMLQI